MLHRKTVSSSTLDLLRALSGHAALQSFHLAGGTSLALRLSPMIFASGCRRR